jgi:ribosomal protein L40E
MYDDEGQQGSGTSSGSAKCEPIDPCPLPRPNPGSACEKRHPLDYTNWGKRKFETGDDKLKDELESMVKAHSYNITFNTYERKQRCCWKCGAMMPLSAKKCKKCKKEFTKGTLPSGITEYIVQEFQINHMGEKTTNPDDEFVSNQKIENRTWRYIHWKYDKARPFPRSEKKQTEIWENLRIKPRYIAQWTGNDETREFSTHPLFPIEEEPAPAVFINLDLVESDYKIDLEKGTITFTNPPPKPAQISMYLSVVKEATSDSQEGSYLELAKKNGVRDTFKGGSFKTIKLKNGETVDNCYVLSTLFFQENTEEVHLNNILKHKDADYQIVDGVSSYAIKFMKTPEKDDNIIVDYLEIFYGAERGFEKIDPALFENQKKNALNSLERFLNLLRSANKEWYEKAYQGMKTPDDIKTAIQEWRMPFPSRKLKEKGFDEEVTYICKCPKCKEEKDKTVKIVTLGILADLRVKCDKCKRRLEITNYLDLNEVTTTPIQWDTDEQSEVRGQIKKQAKILETEPFAIYFKYNRPEPGDPAAEIEAKFVNSKHTPKKLVTIAEELAQQIRKLQQMSLIPAITYYGYASYNDKFQCDYNLDLSLRRALWVRSQIEHILENDFGIKFDHPDMQNIQHGCGEHYADVDRNSSYEPEKHRVVIIQLGSLV